MTYTVLARRWRPARFEDFVGQEAVAKTLKNAIETGRVAHAYLFAGERGTGKTSMVRVFAKALNCEKGPTGTPCNECPICQDIQEGRDIDVLEIDGASYRKVEEISEILKNVGYRPARARFKIYIIDEVHMLSEHAFNALLKTLEEPPPHVKFIFATTEPEELLETIKSRCQRFDFRRISTEAIAKRLRQICDAEKLPADEHALMVIAKNARGGMRDALTILDQIVSFSPDKITAESVYTVLGLPTEDTVAQLMQAIIAKDVGACLKGLDALVNEGKDPLDVLAQLVDYARDLMVLKATGAGLSLQVQDVEGARALAQRLSLEHLVYMIQIFSEARKRARERALGRVAAEVALIKATQFGEVAEIDTLIRRLEELQSRLGVATRVTSYRAPEPQTRPTVATPEVDTEEPPAPLPEGKETVAESPPAAPKVPPDVVLTTEVVRSVWPDIVLKVKLAKARIGMWLSRTELANADNQRITLEFPPTMLTFERQQLEMPEHRQLIERCAAEVLGRSVTVRFVSGKNTAPTRSLSEPSQPASPSREDALSDPIVRKALELFEGRVLNIEER